jgi:O-antigen/teichoic acid export membrane protein
VSEVAKDQPRQGLGRIIFKNAAFGTLGSIALKVISFLFNVYVVRWLGGQRYGQYTIVLGYVGLFQIFLELGMTRYVMREIAQDRSKTHLLFWNLVALRFLLALVGIVVITLGAVIIGYSRELILGIAIYTCTFLLSAFLEPLKEVLRANERFDYVTGLIVLGRIVFMVLGVLFLFGWLSFISLIAADLLALPIQIGVGIWLVKRNHLLPFSPHIRLQTWPTLIRAGLPFGIISLMLTISFSIDTVMLSMYQPEQVVGWYNVAYNLVFSLMFFVGGFYDAIVPSLARTYVDEPEQVQRWYHYSVRAMFRVSLPIAVGGLLVAFPLIRFLYGEEFLPSALGLQILIWDVPLLMFTGFCGNMTTIISEERAAARIYTINAISNIILNAYAIPRFGLVGAALVTVVTDLIGLLQFHFLLRNKLRPPDTTWVLVRMLAASALMGGVVWFARDLHLFIQVGLGAAVYGGLVLAFRLLDDREWAVIWSVLRKFRRSPRAGELGGEAE